MHKVRPNADGTVDVVHELELIAGDIFFNRVGSANLTVNVVVEDDFGVTNHAVEIVNGRGGGGG